jgi:crotonobetainyl-CoA:carnitine CoA-transferase CaiB-like acyl-CoA transferase
MLLAHMGAEVLKIEHGTGDRFRKAWMPVNADHDGYEYLVVNANKKAITLNLKTEKGREIFRALIGKSDVVVENFAPGVAERLGTTYRELSALNPRLIYATNKGYGEGPYDNVRANAATIQGITGWTNEVWRMAGVEGTLTFGIGDEAAGISLALGVCAALYERERTGKGRLIEVNMHEAHFGFMIGNLHMHFEKQRVGYPPKRCADGYVAFHLPHIPDEMWGKFAEAMGHPEAATDPRYSTPEARRARQGEVEDLVASWVRDARRDDLWEVFKSIGMSSAPVLSVAEALEDENIVARESFVDVEHPTAGVVRILRPWVRFDGSAGEITNAAPPMGWDNRSVYGDLLGMSEEEVSRLSVEGVL